MFLITVKAPTMSALREKLIEASNAMFGEGEVVLSTQNDEVTEEELGYGDDAESAPLKSAVYSPHEGVAKPEMPTFVPSNPLAEAFVAPAVNALAEHIAANPPTTSHTETDSRGFPWDERIHASSKALNKDGSWRTKRGVDEKFLGDVEFELRSRPQKPVSQPVPLPVAPYTSPPVQTAPNVMPAQTPVVPALPPAHFQQPIVNMLPPVAPQALPLTPGPVYAPPAQAQPAPVQASYDPVPQPQAGTKPAHTIDTFKANIIPTFVTLIQQGVIKQPYIEQLKEYFQVKEIWDVQNEPAKLQELFDTFVTAGIVTRIG